MIYKYRKSEPRWINFENKTGEKGAGGMENNGAKGHAFAHFENGEEKELCCNELEKDVEILPKTVGTGRFLGASVSILPDEKQYGDIWWGEGEVKVYLDGDRDYPTLAGTGTEDYIGSAWELGEFINRTQGCTCKNGLQASFYRFHIDDEINFSDDIRVTLQAMGGGGADNVRKAKESGAACAIVSCDDGELHGVYKTDITDYKGYTNFYRQDRYRTVAYFYKK